MPSREGAPECVKPFQVLLSDVGLGVVQRCINAGDTGGAIRAAASYNEYGEVVGTILDVTVVTVNLRLSGEEVVPLSMAVGAHTVGVNRV